MGTDAENELESQQNEDEGSPVIPKGSALNPDVPGLDEMDQGEAGTPAEDVPVEPALEEPTTGENIAAEEVAEEGVGGVDIVGNADEDDDDEGPNEPR